MSAPSVTVTSVAATAASAPTVTFTTSPVALAAVTLFTVTLVSAKATLVAPLHVVPLPAMVRSSVRPRYANVGVIALTLGVRVAPPPLPPFLPLVPFAPSWPGGPAGPVHPAASAASHKAHPLSPNIRSLIIGVDRERKRGAKSRDFSPHLPGSRGDVASCARGALIPRGDQAAFAVW